MPYRSASRLPSPSASGPVLMVVCAISRAASIRSLDSQRTRTRLQSFGQAQARQKGALVHGKNRKSLKGRGRRFPCLPSRRRPFLSMHHPASCHTRTQDRNQNAGEQFLGPEIRPAERLGATSAGPAVDVWSRCSFCARSRGELLRFNHRDGGPTKGWREKSAFCTMTDTVRVIRIVRFR
jgi:hypothetical protein